MRAAPAGAARPIAGSAALVFAWSGAALFAASLTYFAFSYFVSFGVAVSAGGRDQPIATNVLLFTAFAAHHSLLARAGVKRRAQALLGPVMERALYTWVASLLFFAVCFMWQPVPGILYIVPYPLSIAGFVVQLAAIVLTLRAASAIDVLDLAGVRPALLARNGGPARHVPLMTSGAYGLVRHPLYFAWALFVFAAPVMTATRFTFAVVSTLYLAVAIPFEERSLIEIFGADYQRYRSRVRWRMIPGIY